MTIRDGLLEQVTTTQKHWCFPCHQDKPRERPDQKGSGQTQTPWLSSGLREQLPREQSKQETVGSVGGGTEGFPEEVIPELGFGG